MHQRAYKDHAKTFLYLPMTNLGPKYDFALGPCEKFNKFMAHLKHILTQELFKIAQNKNKQT